VVRLPAELDDIGTCQMRVAKVTNALNQHWQKRNAAKKKLSGEWFTQRLCHGQLNP
jgi:hypothetical protein